MPMISSAHRTLVHYPDGSSKVIMLYVRPAEGQIIAHGWEVTSVGPGADDGTGVSTDYEISVDRPPSDARPEAPTPPSS
ncbi:MAG TPA: hypothetical protein VIQ56_09425 [Gaiella sp.]|jgi:hypothetical protein